MESKNFLRKESCPSCGSKDNVVVYWNQELKGETFSCMTPGCLHRKTDKDLAGEKSSLKLEGDLPCKEWLTGKKLTTDLCVQYDIRQKDKKFFFGYRHPDGLLLKAKVRDYSKAKDEDMHFFFVGDKTDTAMFGMQACTTRKALVITTGEWDAVYARSMLGKWYSCISVGKGDKGALAEIKANLKFIKTFEKVYLCFDNDESGTQVVEPVAGLLESCFIVHLPQYPTPTGVTKDAKDYALAGREDEFKQAFYAAEQYTPSFIWNPRKLRDSVLEFYFDDSRNSGYPSGFPQLDTIIGGIRLAEVSLLMGNPGRGKSTLARDFMVNLLKQGIPCLYITLEEVAERSTLRLLERLSGRVVVKADPKLTPPELMKLYDTHIPKHLIPANVQGYLSEDDLRNVIYYGAKQQDVKFVLFDHITIATGGVDNQAQAIQRMMKMLNDLALNLRIHIMVITHTRRKESEVQRVDGNPTLLEEGLDEVPTLRDAFGGSGLEQIAHLYMALQKTATGTRLHILKNRSWENTGRVMLYYKNGGYTDGTTEGGGLHGTRRDNVGQQIRAGSIPGKSEMGEIKAEIPAVLEASQTTGDRRDTAGDNTPGQRTVQGTDVEPRLVDAGRVDSGDEGTDGRVVPDEDTPVQSTTPVVLPQTAVDISRRKPIHPKQRKTAQENVQSVGKGDGDKSLSVAERLKGYLNIEAEEDDSD